jgi:hypothetical protein
MNVPKKVIKQAEAKALAHINAVKITMPKYKVEVFYDQVEYYVVEAKSEEAAIEKVEGGDVGDPDAKQDLSWEVQGAEDMGKATGLDEKGRLIVNE